MTKRTRQKPDNLSILPSSTIWSSLNPKWQHGICLLFLFLLPFFQYPDILLGDKRFVAHDIVQWRASAESLIDHKETYGENALWSTNMFSGMPAYIVNNTRVVPHLERLYYTFAPILPALPIWVMMLGVYIFLLRLKLHPVAACIGAVAIAFTTYLPIISGAGHNAKIYAWSFIPWMLIGYHMITRSQKWILSLAVFALVLTLELRAGHPQVTYIFMYLFGIWWVVDLFNAYKEKELPSFARKTGLLLAACVIALLCNIQPYWSIQEYTSYSTRGGTPATETTGLTFEYAMAWSHGWFEMSTLVVPGIMGGGSGDNLYWGPKSFTSGPHYLGAIIFFLGLLALFRYDNKLKWVFFGGGVLTILFALGEHFELLNKLMFNYAPMFSRFRVPEIWLMVSSFSFAVLGAMGAHWLVSLEGKSIPKAIKKLDWPAGIAIGTGLLFLILVNTTLTFEKPGERDMLAMQVATQNDVDPTNPQVQQVVSNYLNTEVIPARQEKAGADSIRFFFYIGFAILLAGAFLGGKIPALYAITGMLILTSIDLILIGNRYIPDSSKIDKSLAIEQIIERQRQPHHDFINVRNSNQVYPYRVFPVDQNPFNSAIPAYFYPSVGGYSGAKMGRYQDLIENVFFSSPDGINVGLMDMLNVRYIVASQPYRIPGYEVVYENSDGFVLEKEDVLPKFFFPDEVIPETSPVEILSLMQQGFEPSQRSWIEKESILPHSPDSLATAEVNTYNAREISATITKNEPGYVFLSEIYYPLGWKAFANGNEVDIYQGNYILRAIYLDAGVSEVTFRFEPLSYYIGGTISWVSNIFLILLLGVGFVHARRKSTNIS